jgi:hypothetical protein
MLLQPPARFIHSAASNAVPLLDSLSLHLAFEERKRKIETKREKSFLLFSMGRLQKSSVLE